MKTKKIEKELIEVLEPLIIEIVEFDEWGKLFKIQELTKELDIVDVILKVGVYYGKYLCNKRNTTKQAVGKNEAKESGRVGEWFVTKDIDKLDNYFI